MSAICRNPVRNDLRRNPLLIVGALLIGVLLSEPAEAQTKFYQYYQKGLDFLEAGDPLRALDQFESAASLAFEDKKRKRIYGTRFIEYLPHYQMAKIYADLEELDNARRELELSQAFESSKQASALLKSLGDPSGVPATPRKAPPPPVRKKAPASIEPPEPRAEPEETPRVVEPPKDIPAPSRKVTPPVREAIPPRVEKKAPPPVDPPKPGVQPRRLSAVMESLEYDPADVPRVGERLAMAVMPFTQEGGEGSYVTQMTEGLINDLVNLRRFTILERNALDKILDEQALAMSGMVDEETAAEAGRLAGADAVILGTLTLAPGFSRVQAKVIDTENGQTLASRDRTTTDSDPASLETEISHLAILIYNDLPLVMGSVIVVEGDTVYIDLGAGHNVRKGTKCVIFREGDPVRHPKTAEVLGVRRELIAEIVITDVQEKMSIAEIIPDSGEGRIGIGDKVLVK